jgi:hypothetical protein
MQHIPEDNATLLKSVPLLSKCPWKQVSKYFSTGAITHEDTVTDETSFVHGTLSMPERCH